MNQQKGFILFITFAMLAMCTALISTFMVKGLTHRKLVFALLQQEQMQQFATSATALAQSLLSFSPEDDKQSEEKSKTTSAESAEKDAPQGQQDPNKKLLQTILPLLGKPKSYHISEIEKDSPLVINLTFFAESGKININGLYNIAQKKFYDEGVEGKDKKVFATWLFDKIATITGKTSLLQPFVEHLKQRNAEFNDVTELLAIKEFADCFSQAIFYKHPFQDEPSDTKNQKLFLTDIFTVATENDTIQPWLLSSGVCALLNITPKNDKNGTLEKKEDKIDLTSFKPQSDWQKDWDTSMKPLYGVSYDQIPEPVRPMLATQFNANVFSTLVTVTNNNNMMVQIFAILRQKRLPDGAIIYDVVKIYQV